ncbi:MAG: helix-turn-helix domain-containing protein [Clostridia bacterium]
MTAIDQKQINKQQTNRYEKYYRQIGLNIAYYRKLRGMSQMALAEATDLSRTHISNIEAPNMKTSLSLESLFDIAGVLAGCTAPRSISVMRNRRDLFANTNRDRAS